MFEDQCRKTGRGGAGRRRAAVLATAVVTSAATVIAGLGAVGPSSSAAAASPKAAVAPVVTTTTTTRPAPVTTTTKPAAATPKPTTTTVPVTTTTTAPVVTTTTTTIPATTTTTGAAPSAAAVPSGACKGDPTAAIAALPDGGTFYASGCYTVPFGIQITHPVTIVGGTFVDPSTGPLDGVNGNGVQKLIDLKPVILVKDTHNVTLRGITVIGGNDDGGYHSSKVGQAGIKVLSSDAVTIDTVTTTNTFGDGLEFWADLPTHKEPTSNLTVRNVTITRAGRHGITVADVFNASITNVEVVSQADAGIDGESDLPGIGIGNVTFTNVTADQGGVNLICALTGPVSFVNSNFTGHITVNNGAGVYPVTFTGGSFVMKSSVSGLPAGAISQKGGVLTFNRVAISRPPRPCGTVYGPSWYLEGNARLVLNQSPVTGMAGTIYAPATMTVNP